MGTLSRWDLYGSSIALTKDLYGNSIALIMHSLDRSLFTHLIVRLIVPYSVT